MEISFQSINPLQFFCRKAIKQLTNFKRVLKIRIVLEGTNAVRNWSLTSSLVLVVTWKLFRYWHGSAVNGYVSNFWLVKVT